MKKFATILLVILTSWSITVAQNEAEEKQYKIEKVVITARAKPAEATLQRTVIDTTILQSLRNATLGDLLSSNSPINIKSYGRGDAQNATFRGTAPSHTQVYWNGVKINSPMLGSVDFSQIPVSFVGNLSVNAGVSSMSVSSGALGGAVNIESIPDWSRKISGEATQSYGSFSTSDSYLNISAGNYTLRSSSKIYYGYSKNDFEFIDRDFRDPQRPDYRRTVRNKNGEYRRRGFMQEFYVKPDSQNYLSFIVWGLDNNANLPQLTTYEGDDQNNRTRREDASLRAVATYKHYAPKMDMMVRFAGDLQAMGFSQQNYTAAGYQTTIDSKGLSRSASATIDLSLKYITNHNIGLSASGTIDYVDSHEDVKDIGFEKSRNEFSIMAALYSQWTPRLASSVAVRGIVVGDDLYATPFAGLEYRFSNSLSAKTRVGYNVHTPTISDLYYVPGGNPDLEAERGLTLESGVGYVRNSMKVDLNLFRSKIEDWIIWLPSHQQYWTPQNLRQVTTQGVEFMVSNEWAFGSYWRLFASGNFTVNHTVNTGEPMVDGDESVGKQLVYVPLISGGVYAKGSWKRLWLSFRLHGESRRFTTTSNNMGVHGSIAPYSLSDLAAGYDWRGWALELKCLNVLNTQYYTVLRRPLPRRSFEATLRVKF